MRSRSSITGPLVLILVGIVFLLRAIQPGFQIADLLFRYWPYLLILWGSIAFLEVTFRFLRQGPIPINGVSGGGWFLAVLVCLVGLSAHEVHGPNNWWHQVGFTRGFEDVMGEDHQYSIAPQKLAVGSEPRILIESFRGDAKITGGEGSEVELTGQKSIHTMDSGTADSTNKQTAVELVRDGNTLIIRCHQDRASSQSSITSNIELTVPSHSTVEVVGTRGDFDISNIGGNVSITSGNAGVRLQDISGRVKIETSRSDVIRCENIKGDVDLRGHGDDVELYKVGGQVTIDAEYHGSISLRELAKPVHVQNLHTTFSVEGIPGEIRLERGSFTAQNVIGPVTLNAKSTDVSFDGFSAGLDLTVDRGDIEIRPNHSPLSRIAVHSTSGNIELSLPEAAKFALNASTRRGEIQNDFGEALTSTSEGKGGKLAGTVGSGPDVDLTTNHGTITVRKSSEDDKPVKEKATEDSNSSVE